MGRKGLNDKSWTDRNSGFRADTGWGDLSKYQNPSLLDTGKSYSKTTSKSAKNWSHCYEKHPALVIPGTDKVIYGGSCSRPLITDADVYIGFDWGMKFTERHWPWKAGREVLFEIADMGVPQKPDEFKKLVAWTIRQLEDGKKVHCGCIGGHGRTGLFFAALICEMTGEKDSISYVRKHYCHKAVESAAQVKFLHDHFGVTGAKGHKDKPGTTSVRSNGTLLYEKQQIELVTPLIAEGKGSIWRHPV